MSPIRAPNFQQEIKDLLGHRKDALGPTADFGFGEAGDPIRCEYQVHVEGTGFDLYEVFSRKDLQLEQRTHSRTWRLAGRTGSSVFRPESACIGSLATSHSQFVIP